MLIASRSRWIASLALMTLVVFGCGPSPVPTTLPSPLASLIPQPSTAPTVIVGPVAVARMVAWLTDRSLACSDPFDLVDGRRQWTCEAGPTAPDQTRYAVQLVANAAGLTEVHASIDQREAPTPDADRARAFLADTIGAAPVTGPAGPQVRQWILDNLAAGGSGTVAGIDANLTPFGPVTELSLLFRSPLP